MADRNVAFCAWSRLYSLSGPPRPDHHHVQSFRKRKSSVHLAGRQLSALRLPGDGTKTVGKGQLVDRSRDSCRLTSGMLLPQPGDAIGRRLPDVLDIFPTIRIAVASLRHSGPGPGQTINLGSVVAFACQLRLVHRFQLAFPSGETAVWTISGDTMSNDGGGLPPHRQQERKGVPGCRGHRRTDVARHLRS